MLRKGTANSTKGNRGSVINCGGLSVRINFILFTLFCSSWFGGYISFLFPSFSPLTPMLFLCTH